MEKFSHVDFDVYVLMSHQYWMSFLLKHQWNTEWAFVQKHDMSTWEKYLKRSKMTVVMVTEKIAPLCISVFSKKLKNIYQIEMIWYLIVVNIINRTYYDHFVIQNFSSGVEKYITHSLHSLGIFLTREENFVCLGGSVIISFHHSLGFYMFGMIRQKYSNFPDLTLCYSLGVGRSWCCQNWAGHAWRNWSRKCQ